MATYRIAKFSQCAIRHINRGCVRGGNVRYQYRQLSASSNKPAASTTPKAVGAAAPATPALTTISSETAAGGVAVTKTTPATPVSEAATASEATSEASAKADATSGVTEEAPQRLFGWKSYVGLVLLTALGYKNVGWYVDRVAEEGRLKREEVETRKVERVKYDAEVVEMRANHAAKLAQMEAMGRANSVSQAQAQAVHTTAAAAQVPSLSTPYVPVEDTNGFVSEADQLRTLRKELQAEMSATKDGERRREIGEEISEVDAEIAEIAQLAGGAGNNANSDSNSGIY